MFGRPIRILDISPFLSNFGDLIYWQYYSKIKESEYSIKFLPYNTNNFGIFLLIGPLSDILQIKSLTDILTIESHSDIFLVRLLSDGF